MTDDLSTAGPLGEAGVRLRALVAHWREEAKHGQAGISQLRDLNSYQAAAATILRALRDADALEAELNALLSAPVVPCVCHVEDGLVREWVLKARAVARQKGFVLSALVVSPPEKEIRFYCAMCEQWFRKRGDCPQCGLTLEKG